MKSKKIFVLLFSLVFVFSLFLSACSTGGSENAGSKDNSGDNNSEKKDDDGSNDEDSQEPQDGGDLVTASTGDVTSFNAYYFNDTASDDISGLMFNGLTKVNKDLEVEPDLAKDWDISDDGLTYTFHLKEGVKFHDGKEMTSADVKFSNKIAMDKDYSGPRAGSFDMIKKIKTPDDYTVVYKLKHKEAPFLQEAPNYPALPKHLLKDVSIKDMEKAKFNTKEPIGTGPYKFVEWKKGQHVKLEKFDDYFDGAPHIDTITVKIIQDANSIMAQFSAGDLDYIDVDATQIDTADKLVDQGKGKLNKTLGLNYDFIGYNEQNDLFKSKKVRQALAHAIDRKSIIDGAVNGEAEIANQPGTPLQKWSFADDVPTFDFDPDKAKEMLADEGWKDHDDDGIIDKDGKKFEFELLTNKGNKRRETITEIVQQDLKKVGIEVHPKIMEFDAFLDKTNPPNWDYDAYVLGWSLSSDPDNKEIFSKKEIKQGLNNVWYKPDKETEKLLQKNSSVIDQDKRGEMIKKTQQNIAEDQPYTFLYYKNNDTMYKPTLHPKIGVDTSYYHIKDWWMEQ